MNNSSEYLPEDPGVNGKAKPFVLAQPRSPEEIRRDTIKASMPRARRDCSRDSRLRSCVGAKWLFGQISDLTFLETFGGDGNGRVCISIRDLERLFGHNRETLSGWRDKLIETGWIWYIEGWPKAQWGICAVCRQPELFPTQVSMPFGLLEGVTAPPASLPENAKMAKTGQNGPFVRPDMTAPPATSDGASGHTGRSFRPQVTAPPASLAGKTRPDLTAPPSSVAGASGQSGRENPPSLAEAPAHNRSLLRSKESGKEEGAPAAPAPAPPVKLRQWEKKLKKLFPRELTAIRENLVKQQKSVDPADNALVADFSLRIEAIDRQLYGAPVPKRGMSAARKAALLRAPAEPPRPTEEELLEGYRYAVAINKPGMITAAQKAAAKRAGL